MLSKMVVKFKFIIRNEMNIPCLLFKLFEFNEKDVFDELFLKNH